VSVSLPRAIETLGTPALLLDREVLERNTHAMSERMQALGVALRPHLKTAKCVAVAALCTRGHSGAITVSTLREAEYFLEHGYRDILYAVGIVPAKFGRVAARRADLRDHRCADGGRCAGRMVRERRARRGGYTPPSGCAPRACHARWSAPGRRRPRCMPRTSPV